MMRVLSAFAFKRYPVAGKIMNSTNRSVHLELYHTRAPDGPAGHGSRFEGSGDPWRC